MVPYCNIPECSYTTVKYCTSQLSSFNTVQSHYHSLQNITTQLLRKILLLFDCTLPGTLARQEKDQAVLTQHVNELRPDAPQALPCIIYEGSKAKRNNFTRNCGLLVLYDETLYSLFLSRNAFTRLRTALISVEIYHINTK